MPYSLHTGSNVTLEFRQDRFTRILAVVIIIIGSLAFALGALLLAAGEVSDVSLITAGGGLMFLCGGLLSRMQLKRIPTRLIFRSDTGCLQIEDSDGQTGELGFGDITGVTMRLRGRRRYIAALLRRNGAWWDVCDFNRKANAESMLRKLDNFIKGARLRNERYPAMPTEQIHIHTTDERTIYRWQDRQSPFAALIILLLFTGAALAGLGAAFQNDWLPAGYYVVGGLYGAFTAYAIFSIIRGYLLDNFISIDQYKIASGRVARGRELERSAGSKHSLELAKLKSIQFSFDSIAGVQRIFVMDQETFETIDAQHNSTGQFGKFFGIIKASLTGFRIVMFGLNSVQILALEVHLRREARRRGAQIE